MEQWVNTKYNNISILWKDGPESRIKYKTIKINKFIPDYYAKRNDGSPQIIIGEAKTANDIDTRHSKNQYISF